MGKATKSTKKFVSSGKLKKTIETRKKQQQIRKKFQNRRGAKSGSKPVVPEEEDDPEDEQDVAQSSKRSSKKGLSVDDILGAAFMDDSDDELEQEEEVDEDEEGSEDGNFEDSASFGSVDDLEEDGQNHLLELSKLAEKDPEFYKYLQENDNELLKFDPNNDQAMDDDALLEDEDVEMTTQQSPTLTIEILRKWQKAILEKRSLRALRKLLVAFRSAAHMNEDGQTLAWNIDNSSVYTKLMSTALRYTPIVLEHHIPYKKLPEGKFKPPTQTDKFKTLQKMILSYFHNVIHVLSQLTDNEMLQLAVTESAKITPYIISNRKAVKLYLKKCLELWSSANDSIRIASFVAIRKLAAVNDQSIIDHVLKGTYLTLVRSSKSTTAYTLPSINLMKNSASEIFCLDQAISYQHAFGYIRQLAIHLRNSMKVKSKEAYKQVYNWQFIHSLDFWSIVLARASDREVEVETGAPSELKPLIYPLVQVSLGAIKLISNGRSYPFHLHVIRSLLHLTRHTQVYIPIAPYILPILTSTLSSSSRPKSSTLKTLDFDVQIRTPQQYLKTYVYVGGLVEEVTYLLSEWLSTKAVHGSIAFPEIVVPILVALRKTMKTVKSHSSSKEVASIKTLVERIEDSVRWTEQKRKEVKLSPNMISAVESWETELKKKVDESPLGKYAKVQLKAREKQRKLMQKAREGESEILEQD
ncbi:Noc2-domain-containing protein [Lentinula aff. detonsa]|uniref:Noc2-domain-containing protein n=1 Tax=Lentinula aff. detonsa TaxID=2804958 RepID=A0AA38ND96_9AGAR|nr:Noc2-domain-containing protein [Lentinula aff. detonsa]KAJ3798890.1 Noc2-domain-containing protein [Lentinula aff. detonsa]